MKSPNSHDPLLSTLIGGLFFMYSLYDLLQS